MSVKLSAFEDKNNPGNGPKYHTGKKCVEPGCDNPAGTAWSPHWCFECNVRRIKRINESFEKLMLGGGKR